MSVCVSRCTKSGDPVENRVIQSIYCEALQHLVTGHEQKADTAQKDSYRSQWACQMFEEEVPWKAPLTSPALLQLQLFLIHWRRRRGEEEEEDDVGDVVW